MRLLYWILVVVVLSCAFGCRFRRRHSGGYLRRSQLCDARFRRGRNESGSAEEQESKRGCKLCVCPQFFLFLPGNVCIYSVLLLEITRRWCVVATGLEAHFCCSQNTHGDARLRRGGNESASMEEQESKGGCIYVQYIECVVYALCFYTGVFCLHTFFFEGRYAGAALLQPV